MCNEATTASMAAIVCKHVAELGYPILRSERDEPLDEADSGWQFLCNLGASETSETGRVWLVKEVIAIEPTLAAFINHSVGTILQRQSAALPWREVSE